MVFAECPPSVRVAADLELLLQKLRRICGFEEWRMSIAHSYRETRRSSRTVSQSFNKHFVFRIEELGEDATGGPNVSFVGQGFVADQDFLGGVYGERSS